ncbi:MAG TPA: hypothetical protein VFJ16_16060 [Longimicrobium sp.]|nr:hypothetical protein [Longimicrobium sp.]
MLRRLAVAFPSAGLGISGSVGLGTHNPLSDLDLLVVDASFQREMQFATVSEGIRTAILCLRPDFDGERERRWMLATSGDVPMLVIVRISFIARDPDGVLGQMQRTLTRLEGERLLRRDELATVRRGHAMEIIRRLGPAGSAGRPQLQMELFAAIVDGWYVRQGLRRDTRQDGERTFVTIAERDAPLAALLRQAVPMTHASLEPLLRAFEHVYEPLDASL